MLLEELSHRIHNSFQQCVRGYENNTTYTIAAEEKNFTEQKSVQHKDDDDDNNNNYYSDLQLVLQEIYSLCAKYSSKSSSNLWFLSFDHILADKGVFWIFVVCYFFRCIAGI